MRRRHARRLTLDAEDFRGAGLFGHPLTAALTTSMATFLLLRMRMNGLLKAVAVHHAADWTAELWRPRGAWHHAGDGRRWRRPSCWCAGLCARDLSIGFVGTIAAALIILPPLLLLLITSTDIGERILTHMYFDDSADVRNLQWLVLNHLNLHDVLFGVPLDRLEILKYQIGLGDGDDGHREFLAADVPQPRRHRLRRLPDRARRCSSFTSVGTTAHPLGWMLLFAAILIDSTSNSLGRKSVDLFFMTACMIAMTGYPATAAGHGAAPPDQSPRLGRTTERLGARPSHANLAGFKS